MPLRYPKIDTTYNELATPIEDAIQNYQPIHRLAADTRARHSEQLRSSSQMMKRIHYIVRPVVYKSVLMDGNDTISNVSTLFSDCHMISISARAQQLVDDAAIAHGIVQMRFYHVCLDAPVLPHHREQARSLTSGAESDLNRRAGYDNPATVARVEEAIVRAIAIRAIGGEQAKWEVVRKAIALSIADVMRELCHLWPSSLTDMTDDHLMGLVMSYYPSARRASDCVSA